MIRNLRLREGRLGLFVCYNDALFVEKRGILTDLEEYRFVGMAIVDFEIPDPAVAHAPAVTCCGDWFL